MQRKARHVSVRLSAFCMTMTLFAIALLPMPRTQVAAGSPFTLSLPVAAVLQASRPRPH